MSGPIGNAVIRTCDEGNRDGMGNNSVNDFSSLNMIFSLRPLFCKI
jgi:hypothetical protein